MKAKHEEAIETSSIKDSFGSCRDFDEHAAQVSPNTGNPKIPFQSKPFSQLKHQAVPSSFN